MGYFEYEITEGKRKGSFNVYQAKNGAIMLAMGDSMITLSFKQINQLNLCLYDLIDFNVDDYNLFYFK